MAGVKLLCRRGSNRRQLCVCFAPCAVVMLYSIQCIVMRFSCEFHVSQYYIRAGGIEPSLEIGRYVYDTRKKYARRRTTPWVHFLSCL